MSDNSVNYFISFKYNPSGTNSAIRDLGRLNGKFSESGRSMAQLSALLNRTQRMYASSTDINRAKAYAGMIDQIKLRIKELEVATASCTTKTRGFFSKLKETTGVGAVGVVGMGAALLGRQVFDELNTIVKAAAQVERYGVTLKTLLQSSSGASERMDEYFDIAKKTPFSLESVVEGGNKLQSLGRYRRQFETYRKNKSTLHCSTHTDDHEGKRDCGGSQLHKIRAYVEPPDAVPVYRASRATFLGACSEPAAERRTQRCVV